MTQSESTEAASLNIVGVAMSECPHDAMPSQRPPLSLLASSCLIENGEGVMLCSLKRQFGMTPSGSCVLGRGWVAGRWQVQAPAASRGGLRGNGWTRTIWNALLYIVCRTFV